MVEQGLIARPVRAGERWTTSGGATTDTVRRSRHRRSRRLAQMLDLGTGEGPRPSEGVMRLYRLLLHLYPASFRAAYGEEMATHLPQAAAYGRRCFAPRVMARAFFRRS